MSVCETICIIITYIHTYSLKKVYQNRFIWFYLVASIVYMYVCTHILNSNNSSQLQSNRIVQQKFMFVSFFCFFFYYEEKLPFSCCYICCCYCCCCIWLSFWHYPLTIWTHRPTWIAWIAFGSKFAFSFNWLLVFFVVLL